MCYRLASRTVDFHSAKGAAGGHCRHGYFVLVSHRIKGGTKVMKRSLFFLTVIVAVGLCVVAANAVTSGQKDSKKDKDSKSAMTWTGCVQNGESDGQFALTDGDGKKYSLISTSVPLKEHIGKKVTVTGTMAPGDPPAGYAGQVTVT